MKESKLSKNCDDLKSESEKEKTELYRYWRGVQRNQLGLSANLYMVFASAILGFVVNYLLMNRYNIELLIKLTLLLGIVIILCSLFLYAKFIENRLIDFRLTSRLIENGFSEKQIGNRTSLLGKKTWRLYKYQRCSLYIGFLVTLLNFLFIIFLGTK